MSHWQKTQLDQVRRIALEALRHQSAMAQELVDRWHIQAISWHQVAEEELASVEQSYQKPNLSDDLLYGLEKMIAFWHAEKEAAEHEREIVSVLLELFEAGRVS